MKLNFLELEQAYTRLQETCDDLLRYTQYLGSRCEMLERKVDTERGKWILAVAESNMYKHGKTLKRLAEE